jgi:protein-S-isoprenylcysteine O-methyltransferase Ste14
VRFVGPGGAGAIDRAGSGQYILTAMSAFDRIQIVFVVFFLALSLWKTLALRRRGISVWIMGREADGLARSLIGLSFLAGMVLWFGLVFLLASGRGRLLPAGLGRAFLDFVPLEVFGICCCAASLLLNLLGLIALGDNWRVGLDRSRPGALITHGVYAFSRNPIMVCTFLYALGLACTYTNPIMLLVLLCAGVSVHYQVRREEAFLAEQHGDRYREYQRRVGRYFTLPARGRDSRPGIR